MLPNRRLNEYLPIRFANGDQVRQFSKPCVHCGQMLNAQHMHGVARLVKEYIAIAAKAHCPTCGQSFSVTCLVDEDKRVQRVVIPYWLFNPYLRLLGGQPDESSLDMTELRSDEPDDAVPQTPPPVVELQMAKEAIGRYQGKPIPAWVRVDGQLFDFDRVAPDSRAARGEFLLDGCLVYRHGVEKC